MIIPINEKYRIESSSLCWDLQKLAKRKKKTGESYMAWEPFKYYNTLAQALRASESRQIREVGGTLGPEVLASIDAIHNQYQSIMDSLDYDKYFIEKEKIAERRRK